MGQLKNSHCPTKKSFPPLVQTEPSYNKETYDNRPPSLTIQSHCSGNKAFPPCDNTGNYNKIDEAIANNGIIDNTDICYKIGTNINEV